MTVDVLIEAAGWQALPDAETIVRRAIASAAPERQDGEVDGEVSVLLCDDGAIADLNGRWRGKPQPTNELSFPAAPAGGAGEVLLGDIAVAFETVAREAGEQGKNIGDHLSHLVVHGFLHLLGYDHEVDGEAERMERLERDILARIGVADPYASRDADT